VEIDIGGTLAGSDHDVLAVTGSLALGGALSVALVNGFPSAAGQTFDVVTAGFAPSGSFVRAASNLKCNTPPRVRCTDAYQYDIPTASA